VIWLAGRSSGSFRSPDAHGLSGLHFKELSAGSAVGLLRQRFFILEMSS